MTTIKLSSRKTHNPCPTVLDFPSSIGTCKQDVYNQRRDRVSLTFQSSFVTHSTYIRGGGIAGLITAVALSQRYPAMNIDVYEAASAFGEIGLGIGMWPRTWEVLERLGLEEEFDAIVCGRRGGPDDGEMDRFYVCKC